MFRINGTGDSVDGHVHPDREVREMYCKTCRHNQSFTKMVGKKRYYIFWIPLPTKENKTVYWQCNQCNRFLYWGEQAEYVIPGSNGGYMRDLTKSEKSENLRNAIDAIKKSRAEEYGYANDKTYPKFYEIEGSFIVVDRDGKDLVGVDIYGHGFSSSKAIKEGTEITREEYNKKVSALIEKE